MQPDMGFPGNLLKGYVAFLARQAKLFANRAVHF
jgi:hypothetical protein